MLLSGQRYPVFIGKLLDGGDGHSAGGKFGQDELMCRDMERSAMLRAAEALGENRPNCVVRTRNRTKDRQQQPLRDDPNGSSRSDTAHRLTRQVHQRVVPQMLASIWHEHDRDVRHKLRVVKGQNMFSGR